MLTIFEANRERDTGSELTMELRLCGTGTNSTPGDEVGNVLRRDSVQKLGSDGNADVGKIAQELTSLTETFVDLEGAIEVRIIDETLPSNGGAGFLMKGQ